MERFLRAKGDSVRKAAKHLRACLSWRESIGTGTPFFFPTNSLKKQNSLDDLLLESSLLFVCSVKIESRFCFLNLAFLL